MGQNASKSDKMPVNGENASKMFRPKGPIRAKL